MRYSDENISLSIKAVDELANTRHSFYHSKFFAGDCKQCLEELTAAIRKVITRD